MQQAMRVDIKPGQREVQQSLVTPVIATALMVQYSAVWDNLSEAAAEVLHCPRCSHTVVDVHGVCRYCRENAYQVHGFHERMCACECIRVRGYIWKYTHNPYHHWCWPVMQSHCSH